jgi:hypothetical protein
MKLRAVHAARQGSGGMRVPKFFTGRRTEDSRPIVTVGPRVLGPRQALSNVMVIAARLAYDWLATKLLTAVAVNARAVT